MNEKEIIIEALSQTLDDFEKDQTIVEFRERYSQTAQGDNKGKFEKGYAQFIQKIKDLRTSVEKDVPVNTKEKISLLCQVIEFLESHTLHSRNIMEKNIPDIDTTVFNEKLKDIDVLRKRYCGDVAPESVDEAIKHLTGS